MHLHWKQRGMLAIPVVQHVCKMIVQSVAWLHSHDIVHRDLKPDNFLMNRKEIQDPDCCIYLSDFGTAVELQPGKRLCEECGTKTYWAPEFYELNYGIAVDMWAVGVITFGLVTGHLPFKEKGDCRTKPVHRLVRATRHGEHFILSALAKVERKRLTAMQALEHPFLTTQLRKLSSFGLESKKFAKKVMCKSG